MKSLNTKLLLSALGIALLATPAFAQHRRWQDPPRALYNYQVTPGNSYSVYPNDAIRSGSADSVDSGAEFNVMH
jgi:hypothetical protein